jgi:hypothetical protein
VTNRGRAATVAAPSRFVAVMSVTRVLFVRLALVVLIAAGVMPSAPERAQAQDCEYGAFGCGHAEQHHQYLDWKPRTGKGSCCNGDDCRPVRARVEDDGSWAVWIPEFRRWVPVPAFAVGEPDRFGDGRSHVCSTKPMLTVPVFHIFCFSPTGSKS